MRPSANERASLELLGMLPSNAGPITIIQEDLNATAGRHGMRSQRERMTAHNQESPKPLDRAIQGMETGYEEAIGLYQTFGGC